MMRTLTTWLTVLAHHCVFMSRIADRSIPVLPSIVVLFNRPSRSIIETVFGETPKRRDASLHDTITASSSPCTLAMARISAMIRPIRSLISRRTILPFPFHCDSEHGVVVSVLNNRISSFRFFLSCQYRRGCTQRNEITIIRYPPCRTPNRKRVKEIRPLSRRKQFAWCKYLLLVHIDLMLVVRAYGNRPRTSHFYLPLHLFVVAHRRRMVITLRGFDIYTYQTPCIFVVVL